MKILSLIPKWFWHRNLFSRLQPRLMAMILVLVMPICLISVAISCILAVQGDRLVYENANNALGLYLDQVALRAYYEETDLTADFPEAAASRIAEMYPSVVANQGRLYVSQDGIWAYRVLSEEGETGEAERFDALLNGGQHYLWQQNDGSLRVLVAFSFSLSLRSLSLWFWISLSAALVTLLMCPFLYKRLKLDILDPLETLNTATQAFGEDRSYRIPPQPERVSEDFRLLFGSFNDMAKEVQESYEKDIKVLETEMDNLRLQVNPHMLLNSYNTIYALAESKNYPVIQDYTLCLVDYFRYILRQGQQLSTVRQELEFVDNFIRIQRIRFPGRFSYVYQAEDACMEARIPPLLIENFVENAVKYALNPSEAIEIVVSVRKEQNKNGKETLHIAITDTGSGIRPEVLEKLKAHEPYIDENGHRHIGIYNCLRRIELFYGEEGEVSFSSSEGMGTQIYLIVPFLSADRIEEKKGETHERSDRG